MRIKHRIKHTPFSEWRHYIGCTISFVTFCLLLISFVTPYWLQSWSRLHTSFMRHGLWEFCLKGYVDRTDMDMVSYYDCWWILSPYYAKIYTQLVPFWFIIIQVLLSISIAIQLILFVLLLAYLCERIRHVERRIFSIVLMTVGHAITACALFPAVLVFGVNYQDPDWMPEPKFNWPSWSYGCAILATFSSIFAAICFGLIARELRRDLEDYTMDFPMSTYIKHRRRWRLRRRHSVEDAENMAVTQVPKVPSTQRMDDVIAMSELSHGSLYQPSQNEQPLSRSVSNSQLTNFESPPPSIQGRPTAYDHGSDV
ncbi:PMP-22/EMP/MP20/Claudin tight junction [Paragonimus heterotremus]|uniref:PMP-22/EMP/MP20/Claudin tight junction n=1 Tax=Paragonimus heterotremus TaxID=100268 RepID=A0A8J4SZK2_9TREM|nr:PMP-22/EMP/MP20/Claudin tight junction [Paragonimus heterotremus]